jgi:DNA-binding PadR family transcriptional regulator
VGDAMNSDFLSLIKESEALNSDVFSLIRLLLLSSIASVGADGVTYRELKAALRVSDGALFTNLKSLEKTGYVVSEEITLEGKKLQSFKITQEGLIAWERIRNWLKKFVECGGKNNESG